MSEFTHGRYLVTGRRSYRDHRPGEIFEARLYRLAEQRALERGDISLLERIQPGIEETVHRLPADWPHDTAIRRTERTTHGR